MSRIQDILSKAERDGTARRTRPLADADAAVLPSFEPARRTAVPTAPQAAPVAVRPPRETAGARLDTRLAAALAPHSIAAEQYRSLRTRIKRAEATRTLRAIVVTSPGKGDGKSLTAANLALTMGQEHQQRVLLVDGDLRRPSVHQLFGLPQGPGLADVLANEADLADALVAVPDRHITVLTAGTLPSNPAELLGSASMRRTIDTLRTQFDRIVIDMPPVAPLADLQIVAPLADGVLLIVRAGITPKPAIERAIAGLDRSKLLGLVLNESGGSSQDASVYEGYGYIAG